MTSRALLDRMERVGRTSLIALSAFLAVLFLVAVAHRAGYPYALEELEGNMVRTAERLAHHQPIYVAPNIHFVPYMYAPLYSYVSAMVLHVTGTGFFPLRLVSIVSTLGVFVMLALLVWRETRSWPAALAAMGLYAGCYPMCGNWYDLARLDSLLIFLVLIALYCTRWLHPVIAALVWVAAFQTKQSILPAAFILLCCRFGEMRKMLAGLLVLTAGVAGSVWWLNHTTHGWYGFYAFRVPSANSDLLARPFFLFWPQVLHTLGLAAVVILAATIVRRPSLRSLGARFYMASTIFVLLGWFIMMHSGSTQNVYMPICMVMALLFGLATHRLLQEPSQQIRLIGLAAVGLQLIALIYNPGEFKPVPEQRRSAEMAVNAARLLGGRVYMPRNTYYAEMAGAPEMVDVVAFQDAQRPLPKAEQMRLRSEMEAMLTNGGLEGVFLEGSKGVKSFSERNTLDVNWVAKYPVRMPLPDATAQSHPAWFLLRCTLPFAEGNISAAAPQSPVCPQRQ